LGFSSFFFFFSVLSVPSPLATTVGGYPDRGRTIIPLSHLETGSNCPRRNAHDRGPRSPHRKGHPSPTLLPRRRGSGRSMLSPARRDTCASPEGRGACRLRNVVALVRRG
jgi:hypothetical protein